MSAESSFPRQFGQYVLVAQLGDDGLGTVYRALHASDERGFMRLRILQSPELSPEAVRAEIRKNASHVMSLADKAVVLRPDMRIIDGIPFVAWYESAGWTLDLVLAKLRAAGRRIPAEYALLVAERVAAAAAHAWFSLIDGEHFHHGLIWPGFVSVSNDAEVRLGGFGLAGSVLPVLTKPRLLRDITPYVAPEVRSSGRVGSNSDVYSLGVLLLELLTCRRATLEHRMPELRADDPFADEISACLRRAIAEPAERFPSVVVMHRCLQELLASNPHALSTASFGVFLYNLLNPESRALPFSDADSTNPIEVEAPAPPGADFLAEEESETSTSSIEERRTRKMTPLLPSTAHEEISFPTLSAEAMAGEIRSEPEGGSRPLPASTPSSEKPNTRPELSDLSLSIANPPRQVARWAAFVTTAAIVVVAVTAIGRLHAGRPINRPAALPAVAAPTVVPPVLESSAMPQPAAPVSAVKKKNLPGLTLHRAVSHEPVARSPHQPAASDVVAASAEGDRRDARGSRLGAALARIDAERLEASQLAAELFASGRSSEQEGERLFGEQDWRGAHASFERAMTLFRHAENSAREERVRRVKLLPADSPQ